MYFVIHNTFCTKHTTSETQIIPINCIFFTGSCVLVLHLLPFRQADEYLAAGNKYFCDFGSYLSQGSAVQDRAVEKANATRLAPASKGASHLLARSTATWAPFLVLVMF